MKRLQVFLTVGSQMPFDRLTKTVARWSAQRPAVAVTAQIGASSLNPTSLWPMHCRSTLGPHDYERQCRQAHLMVAHAGMGSILTALELDRPLVVLPRRGHLRETRNDHQLHTALQLLAQQAREAAGFDASSQPLPSVQVVLDETRLPEVLDRMCTALLARDTPEAPRAMQSPAATPAGESRPARAALIQHLRALIDSIRPA